MKQLALEYGVPLKEDKLVSAMHSDNDTVAAIAKVYVSALRALSLYNGDLSIDNEEFSQMSEYIMKPQSIPNFNVRTVGYMFQKSINKIADTVLDRYSPIRENIMDIDYKIVESMDDIILKDDFSIYLETYGYDYHKDEVLGISIYNNDISYYIPFDVLEKNPTILNSSYKKYTYDLKKLIYVLHRHK